MTAHSATFLLAGAAMLSLTGTPAAAQVDDGIVLNIMRECAKIDDPGARLACYDNNIRSAGESSRVTVPGQVPQGGGGAPVTPTGRTGFGNEDIRTPQRSGPQEGEAPSVTSQVARVAPREPGVYLLTLEDGAQWMFAESVGRSYRVPNPGDTITIDRAALGSFLMRHDDQISVRVRRVR